MQRIESSDDVVEGVDVDAWPRADALTIPPPPRSHFMPTHDRAARRRIRRGEREAVERERALAAEAFAAVCWFALPEAIAERTPVGADVDDLCRWMDAVPSWMWTWRRPSDAVPALTAGWAPVRSNHLRGERRPLVWIGRAPPYRRPFPLPWARPDGDDNDGSSDGARVPSPYRRQPSARVLEARALDEAMADADDPAYGEILRDMIDRRVLGDDLVDGSGVRGARPSIFSAGPFDVYLHARIDLYERPLPHDVYIVPRLDMVPELPPPPPPRPRRQRDRTQSFRRAPAHAAARNYGHVSLE
jgi:hypothetical protein